MVSKFIRVSNQQGACNESGQVCEHGVSAGQLPCRFASLMVCDMRYKELIGDGNKSDDEDAEELADLRRIEAVKPVY